VNQSQLSGYSGAALVILKQVVAGVLASGSLCPSRNHADVVLRTVSRESLAHVLSPEVHRWRESRYHSESDITDLDDIGGGNSERLRWPVLRTDLTDLPDKGWLSCRLRGVFSSTDCGPAFTAAKANLGMQGGCRRVAQKSSIRQEILPDEVPSGTNFNPARSHEFLSDEVPSDEGLGGKIKTGIGWPSVSSSSAKIPLSTTCA